jgi:hypothetical protein
MIFLLKIFLQHSSLAQTFFHNACPAPLIETMPPLSSVGKAPQILFPEIF